MSRLSHRLLRAAFAAFTLLFGLALGATPASALDLKINFQPASAPVPSGYVADTGAAYSSTTGRGWVRQDSLDNATHVPIDFTDRTRRRWVSGDPRQLTLIHMESSSVPTTRAAYEVDVPNGSYVVTASVGDPGNYDSTHVVNAEGRSLIDAFTPAAPIDFKVATRTVLVEDGKLTIDSIGGLNTKIDYLDISSAPTDTVAPDAPAGITTQGGSGKITLNWTASPEPDIAGYRVFRSSTSTVSTSGAPRSGAKVLASPTFVDTVTDTSRYYYVVQAVDYSGNVSAASTVVSDTASNSGGTNVDLKINFGPSSASPPLGYIADTGQAYDATRGRGWVREDTLPLANRTALDLTSRTRQRSANADIRLDTFVHMQTGVTGNFVRGAYEVVVPPGNYVVTAAVGDATNYDSNHVVNIEGRPLIQSFVPTPQQPFQTASGTFAVTDGKLTLDEIGGSNTKLDYITIKSGAVDETPPAQPGGLTAVGGTGQVTVSWTANTESDLAGYNLFRSTTTPVPTTGSPINGTTLLTGQSYNDEAVVNDTKYYYALVAVDTSGNKSPVSPEANATPTPPPPAGFELHVDYKPVSGPAPASGYVADTGQPFDATRGFGWVTQATLGSATPTPYDASSRTRRRYVASDVRRDTLIHTDGSFTPPVAWEAIVPTGDYKVTVSAGDPSNFDSRHVVNVEGTKAVDYQATTTTREMVGTVNVRVTDGKLTVDTIGGSNTKIQYIDITATGDSTDETPPATPTGLVAGADVNGIHLSWAPNGESDLAGYYLYRSTELPVDVSGTALSGPSPITITSFDDTTARPTVPYYYAVVAADRSGNRSGASNPTTAKQPAIPVNRSFNFQPSNAPTVFGYTVDAGDGFTAARGYGWIREDTARDPVLANHVPVSISSRMRDRNKIADQRLDTFAHMQYSADEKVAWELVVPNGSYDVELSVGDPQSYDSLHTINVEGQRYLTEFLPTSSSAFRTVNATVAVTDGRLTVDAIGGTNTKIDYLKVTNADTGTRPSIGEVQPADGATLVSRTRAVTAELNLPNVGAGVDTATLDADSVRLERVADGSAVSANRNTSGGGDVIVVQPRSALEANTTYRFSVTSALKDVSGASFVPKTTTFTTGNSTTTTTSPARFTKTPQSAGQGEFMASITMGPDDRLYATTLDGKILRFPVDAATGALGSPTTITTIADNENGPRSVLGLAFDPASTPTNPILWVSQGDPAYVGSPDWSGKISRLTGANLENIEDLIVGLPRSVRDHQTNSLAFGPDGALYVTQGSSTATGETDAQWGLRHEHLLTAAVLRIDTAALTQPVDVKTEDGGTYNPFAANAPVTIWASGIRNAYDLVWADNGQLYVPVNGSAAGGNVPSTPATLPATCANRSDVGTNGPFTGPAVSGFSGVSVQPDILVRAVQGGYYGHPNPARCEYTFMGGNPTSSIDPYELINYPVGTQPDRNWRRPSWNFGNHFSPNGVVQYHGTAWSNALKDWLLVTRYSAGDDIVALKIDPDTKEVVDQQDGIPGLGGLTDPLDIAQDTRNGNIYVTELGAARITLMQPDETGGKPRAGITPSKVVENDAIGDAPSAAREITIRNTGNAPMRLNSVGISGPAASQFVLSHVPATPQLIAPDNEVTLDVQYNATAIGIQTAQLDVATDDPDTPVASIPLRAIGTPGYEGTNEPSLQRVLDVHQIPVSVGDDDPSTTALPDGTRVGDEVSIQSLRRVDPTKKVSIDLLAVFSPKGPGSTVGSIGWTGVNDSEDTTSLATISNDDYQSVAPVADGKLSFDPGSGSFGLWMSSASQDFRKVFSEDGLNAVNGLSHQARGYQLKDSTGAVVDNAYVVAWEARSPFGADFQDVVYVIRNVRPDGSGAGRVDITNLDGQPFDDRLAFNRIGSLATPPANSVHDQAKVRLRNGGSTPLNITGLPVTGPFQVVSAPALPATLAPGATTDVTVKFIAESGRVSTGALTVQSTAAETPSLRVDLAGYWQPAPEGTNEPTLAEMVNGVFGYGTRILSSGQTLNQKGHVTAVGDEVLSPYWRRLDPSKSVRVTQLAAFKTQNSTATFRWYQRGGDVRRNVLSYDSRDAQSVLPRGGSIPAPSAQATTTIQPAAEFGFQIDSEYSDPTLNYTGADVANGCTAPCGHHVRAWPVKNRAGQIVSGSYLIAMDYSGINYDYNDNLYLVTNLTPDTDTQPVLARIDTGSSQSYTDTRGRVWQSDYGLFTPATAFDEGNRNDPIANTADDKMYATYRGNVGNVAQAQRVLNYRIPTGTATKVDVRLYFAERAWTSSGKRKFDISAEGVRLVSGLDIFGNVFAKDMAWSKAFNGIAINDGALDLSFAATVDYPSIAGIEVLCVDTCGSD